MAALHKFTKRIAWTGRIWIAMLAAFFLGSIAVTGSAESDQICSFDQVANPRVIEQFFGLVETERGLWPEWQLEAFSTGEWQTNPPPLAFHVPASQEENTGVLRLQVDRASAGEDLILGLTYDDDKGKGSLFIGLSYWPEGAADDTSAIFLADLFGNIMNGQGDPGYAEARTTARYFEIPIQSFSAPYLSVDIYRGKGEITVSGAVLYTKSEFYYWLEQALAQGMDGLEMEDNAVAREQGLAGARERKESADLAPADLASGARVAPEMSEAGRPGLAPLAEQIAAAVQLAANYMITRSVLSGGGTRQTSPAFIMEDSIGQSSAIGFSYGNGITLHAGYQQAETERLELWNVSVTPQPYQQGGQRRFNPILGETSTFSYVLSTSARAVTVNVYDQNGALVRTLLAQQQQNGGLHTVAWDGRNDSGGFVSSNRKYTNTLSAISYDGVVTNYQTVNINEIRIEVADNIPVIKSVADQPDPFVPDADFTSTISYVTAAPVGINSMNMLIEVYSNDFSGLPVRAWSTNQLVGPNSVVWDGTDTSGATLPDGLYLYAINHDVPPANRANRQTGAIRLIRANTQSVTSADGQVTVHFSGSSVVSITPASPAEASSALFAIKTADPGWMLESIIYRIEAAPPATFAPPALMAFKYNQAISGDIVQKLQIRRFNETNQTWELLPVQFVDYANHQILAEVTSLSLFALFTGEQTIPAVLPAAVRIEPETLNVNPGILTAFVSLPAGYPVSGITFATCDGALYERMMSNDGNEMIIKFRRQAIEEALAQIGETIDIYFIIRGVWQDSAGNSRVFQGADSITKIVGAR